MKVPLKSTLFLDIPFIIWYYYIVKWNESQIKCLNLVRNHWQGSNPDEAK